MKKLPPEEEAKSTLPVNSTSPTIITPLKKQKRVQWDNSLKNAKALVTQSPKQTIQRPASAYHIETATVLSKELIGSPGFQGTSNTQRDSLIHYIHSAASARQAATIEATKTKRNSAWKCWAAFLLQVGATSLHLDGFSAFQKNILMSAFAQSVREATFST